jgi:biotin transport system ATP-binding protein
MTHSPPPTRPIIDIRGLSHRFANGTWGLKDINLSIREGELVVIAGKNGSGKTLFARHLNGLLKPTAGSIQVAGLDVQKHLLKVRQLVGLVFQDADSQIIGQTIYEDVAFGPENLKLNRNVVRERVAQALALTGLDGRAESPTHFLSGGEKRRVTIAGVLAMQPRVLVLDEPFANLDYPGVRQILTHLLQLHQNGYTLIVITHDLSTMLAYATRLVLMETGRIIRDGLPATVLPDVEKAGVRNPLGTFLTVESLSW